MIRMTFAVASIGLLGACGLDPKNFETTPVVVQSAEGPVTCQLYTKGMTSWDRAIDRPDSMSVQTADALCQQEGKREQSGA